MGYVPPRIDYGVLDKMTPENRERAIRQYRAELRDAIARNRSMGAGGLWMLVATVAFCAVVLAASFARAEVLIVSTAKPAPAKCHCRVTGECTCDVCRCPQYSAPPGGWPVSTPAKPAAPKKLTGDPRIDGGMYVRTCSPNGTCKQRWVPLSELPEFARRPVMQVPERTKAVYVPRVQKQGRGLFGWR
jgi:hypothetical protein